MFAGLQQRLESVFWARNPATAASSSQLARAGDSTTNVSLSPPPQSAELPLSLSILRTLGLSWRTTSQPAPDSVMRLPSRTIPVHSKAGVSHRVLDLSSQPPCEIPPRLIQRRTEVDPILSPYSDIWLGDYTPEVDESRKLLVALKSPSGFDSQKRGGNLKEFTSCIGRWSALEHTHLLTFLGTCFMDVGLVWRTCFVSPWMENGNMTQYLDAHPDANILPILAGVAKGLVYLHSLEPPLVHGDVRRSNVLIDENGQALLCDYEMIILREELLGESIASFQWMRWMAPERLAPLNFGLRLADARAPAADMFSFGMLIYEILSKDKPFGNGVKDIDAGRLLVSGERPPLQKEWEDATSSAPLVSMIRECWHAERALRPTAEHIVLSLTTLIEEA